MRESIVLLLLVMALTAYTLAPMLDGAPFGSAAEAEGGWPPAGASASTMSTAPPLTILDADQGEGDFSLRLAAFLPAHQRLQEEAAAGPRSKW